MGEGNLQLPHLQQPYLNHCGCTIITSVKPLSFPSDAGINGHNAIMQRMQGNSDEEQ
jgi:hypothetical protein